MNIQLPPILFYAVGTVLIVFGSLRALHLGWMRRKDDGLSEPEPGEVGSFERDAQRAARRTRDARRHIVFGLVWVAMGLFLVISTLLHTRR